MIDNTNRDKLTLLMAQHLANTNMKGVVATRVIEPNLFHVAMIDDHNKVETFTVRVCKKRPSAYPRDTDAGMVEDEGQENERVNDRFAERE